MGVDISITTIIGCEVSGKLYKTITETTVTKNKQNGCDHANDAGPHCKHCGSKVKKTEKTTKCVLEIDGDWGENIIGTEFSVFDTRYESDSDGQAFIGVEMFSMGADGAGNQAEQIPLDNLESIKKELQEFLTPLDLWDPDSCGVWNILTYS
jgi:hypothetical protein